MRPEDRFYMDSHEWAKLDGNTATIGVTDFAIEQLGELVFLDLPEVGATISKGEAFGEVESVKAVSDLIAPVSGEIVAVNTDLPDALEPLQEDPHEAGWLIKVTLSNQGELDSLKKVEAYQELVAATR